MVTVARTPLQVTSRESALSRACTFAVLLHACRLRSGAGFLQAVSCSPDRDAVEDSPLPWTDGREAQTSLLGLKTKALGGES